MRNLFKETENILNRNGKTFDDVVSIQGNDFAITVDNFIKVAKETNYDSGYGSQEVATDIKIIGDGWWLERAEYDGSEWWEFKKLPKIITETKSVNRLACGTYGYAFLKEINK